MSQNTRSARQHQLKARSGVPRELLERIDLAEKYRLSVEQCARLQSENDTLRERLAASKRRSA